ncbi:MAG: hypothetical protein JWO89_3718 [Verrucomicrobiaceae bacterium]|nr:hypothetical protein [Verrucomicrobiaceae bacterium]
MVRNAIYEPLRLVSRDSRSWFEICPWSDDGAFTALRLEAQIDVGGSRFTALNRSVIPLNLAEFPPAIDRFIMDRSVRPSLDGTDDSFFRLTTRSPLQVCCHFSIGDTYCGGPGPHETYRLTGTFEIDQDRLHQIHEYFRRLALIPSWA